MRPTPCLALSLLLAAVPAQVPGIASDPVAVPATSVDRTPESTGSTLSLLTAMHVDPVAGRSRQPLSPAQPETGGRQLRLEMAGAAPPESGSPVPEPTTLLLVGTGLVGVAFTARQSRRKRSS